MGQFCINALSPRYNIRALLSSHFNFAAGRGGSARFPPLRRAVAGEREEHRGNLCEPPGEKPLSEKACHHLNSVPGA